MTTPSTTYELRAGSLSDGELRVVRVVGKERLSHPYHFDVEVFSSDLARQVERDVIGASARLAIHANGIERQFHGLVHECEALGVVHYQQRQRVHYRLTLAPRMWLLTQRRRSRVFQEQRVDQIIRTVLTEALIPCRFLLRHQYPTRDLYIQYEETDLEFVTRLCGESGLLYFFEQPPAELSDAIEGAGEVVATASRLTGGALGGGVVPSGEVAVFCDDAALYPSLSQSLLDIVGNLVSPLGGAGAVATSVASEIVGALGAIGQDDTLHYHPSADALEGGQGDVVQSFTMRGAMRSTHAHFRDCDPRRPNAPMAFSHVDHGHHFDGLLREAIGHGPGAALERAATALAAEATGALTEQLGEATGVSPTGAELEIYDHHLRGLFPSWDHEGREPERMLRSARRDAVIALGTSLCPRLACGRRFRLADHPLERLDGEYVVTEVEHRGRAYEVPSTGGVEEPIYHNSFRCTPAHVTYVVAQQPRRTVQTCVTATVVADVGEVDASGDAMIKVKFHWDRREKNKNTTCWIRCMQPWAGAGWGCQFIPRKGMEVVVGFDGGDVDKPIVVGAVYNGVNPPPFRLPDEQTRSGIRTRSTPNAHGGNELSFEDAAGGEQIFLHAERDLDVVVDHDRTLHVDHDDSNDVRGQQRIAVGGEQTIVVEGGRSQTIRNQDETTVEGTATTSVRGTLHVDVTEDEHHRIGGARHLEVRGEQSAEVGSMMLRCGGSMTEMVGSQDAPGSRSVVVEGRNEIAASLSNRIASDGEIILQCGASYLRIGPEQIEVGTPKLVLQGEGARIVLAEDAVRMFASSALQGIASEVTMASDGAGLGLTSEASFDGSKVLLNSPASADDPYEPPNRETTTIDLVDDRGEPMAHQRFVITHEDGSTTSGMLDRNGHAEIELTQGGRIAFPGVQEVESA